jgi:peptidoglycan/xylan/chitin deacetylase (PgdA/CDA1 family)
MTIACGACGPIGEQGLGGEAGAGNGGSGAAAGSGGSGAGAGTAGNAGQATAGMGGEPPVASNVGMIRVESISTWQGNMTAAYSIIHDDACDYPLDSLITTAEPALTARGLRAGFGAIVERCQERKLWPQLQNIIKHGHEIVCHSWTHADFNDPEKPVDLSIQVDQATKVLADNLTGQKIEYFIFPFDRFTPSQVEHLSTVGYTGARAGEKGVNAANFPDPMRGAFDVYNGENSIYYPEFADVLKAYVDDAIAKGGWAIREFHGVQDSSWESVPTVDYEAHLDYIKAKADAGELWVDTPSRVQHYRFARDFCAMPQVEGAVLGFGVPTEPCKANAIALSFVIATDVDVPALRAEALPSKRIGEKRYLVDADPTLGRVVLRGELAVGGAP